MASKGALSAGEPSQKKTGSSWLSRSKSALVGGSNNSSSSSLNSGKEMTKAASEGAKGKERERDPPPSPKVIIGAVKDEWPLYSCRAKDYTLGEPVGFGSSAVVYLASYAPVASTSNGGPPPKPLPCAVKCVDVDSLSKSADIDRLRRETQLMSLSKHPNVLRVRGEWIEGSKLYIASRYMSPGSLLDISRFAHPEGFEEAVIATALKQALNGIVYLHQNGWIHRDIKAANMLLDDDGTLLLADFGVSSYIFQDTSSAGSRNAQGRALSVVGTPAHMAPELVSKRPHDSKVDIWSFGITALELAQGRAPNSLFPVAKVLSKTVIDEPPMLDREGGKYKYSLAMQQMIDSCLKKDPSKRPTAEKLLQHPFFKFAKKPSYLVSAILQGLPPLPDRQDRRRRQSVSHGDSIASWDFTNTAPNSPGIRDPTTPGTRDDPFATFNMSPAGSLNRHPNPNATATATGASESSNRGSILPPSFRQRQSSTHSTQSIRSHKKRLSFDELPSTLSTSERERPKSHIPTLVENHELVNGEGGAEDGENNRGRREERQEVE